MKTFETEIAVIGAGCSGLSLGAHYAHTGKGGRRIIYIEQRPEYKNDRSWCFWKQKDMAIPLFDDCISQKWPQWRFSGQAFEMICPGRKMEYCFISALAFYRKAQAIIAEDRRQTLLLNEQIKDITEDFGENGKNICLHTNNTRIYSDTVIDTRPLQEEKLKNFPMFQIFHGYEIETKRPVFDEQTVGLMDEMRSENQEFKFVYTLPFSPYKALVEYTAFSRIFYRPEQLKDRLEKHLADKQIKDYKLLREESGILPMGFSKEKNRKKETTNIIRAGSHAGALRASSGYAFLRIQKWAEIIAGKLSNTDFSYHDTAYTYSSSTERFLDNTFIRALTGDMQKSMQIFRQMAQTMPPDRFARFMADQASPLDIGCLILSVPKAPFIRAALNGTD